MNETINLRAHHIKHLHRAVLHGADVQTMSKYISPYLGETIDFEVGIYRQIIQNPDIQIKIIDSLDVLCKNGCPKLRSECTGQLGKDADANAAKLYNLKIGKIYSSKDLVSELRSRKYPNLLEELSFHSPKS